MLLNIFRNYLYNRIESSLIESTLIKFADTILSGEKKNQKGILQQDLDKLDECPCKSSMKFNKGKVLYLALNDQRIQYSLGRICVV